MLDDPSDFRLWLAAKDPDEIVGRRMISDDCAVARYLNERTAETWCVGPFDPDWRAELDGNPEIHFDLPAWVRDFATRFDQSTGDVTAKVALTLFDEVTA